MRTSGRVAAQLVVAALVALVLAGCGDDDDDEPPAADGSPRPTATAASPQPTSDASPGRSPAASAGTRAVAVYWLGAASEPRGPRLYREFVRRPSTADPVRDAVEAMLGLEPSDPDHTSLWADGTTVRGVRREGSTAVVDLSQEATQNRGGSGFEAMSLQQLVYTATAADPSVRAVALRIEGRTVESLWGAVGTEEPLRRAPAVEVLGPVWIDQAEGATVTDEVTGTATVFEATVSWDVRQGGRTVQEGFATATEGAPGRGAWKAELDVPPGTYELRAWESSAKDGSMTWLETRTIRVV